VRDVDPPRTFRISTLFQILLFVVAPRQCMGQSQLSLTAIDSDIVAAANPLCLDGTLPGYYLYRNSASTSWVIFFQGGGFCSSLSECATRASDTSAESVGSSTSYPATMDGVGVYSSNPQINPYFYDWNRVYVPYCDGFFFSGDRDSNETISSSLTLHFRGRANLGSTITALKRQGLSSATEVLFSGASAGAVAILYNSGYLKSQMPASATVKFAPISGYFHNGPTASGGTSPLATRLQAGYQPGVHNAIPIPGNECMNSGAMSSASCLLPNNTYAYVANPFFIINSALDSFSLQFYQSQNCGVDPFVNPSTQLDNCNSAQILEYNVWQASFMADLTSNPSYSRAGNGHFIYSCYEHANSENDDQFRMLTLNCTVRLNEALTRWYQSSTSTPACENTLLPCTPNVCDKTCNPTCRLDGTQSNGPAGSCSSVGQGSTCSASATTQAPTPCNNGGNGGGSSDSNDPDSGETAGIVVGVLVGLTLIAAGLYYFRCRRNSPDQEVSLNGPSIHQPREIRTSMSIKV